MTGPALAFRSIFLATALALAAPARAQYLENELPEPVRGLEMEEKLGAQIPLDIILTGSDGKEARIGAYFSQGKPVVLLMAYYDCPLVCPLIQQKLVESLNGVDFTIGEDFNVVVVSFDPSNTTAMALESEQFLLSGYDRDASPEIEAGVAYHTASAPAAKMLGDAIGYHFRYLPETGEYAHPVAIAILTPDGKVSRYLFGFNYPPRDVKLALLEASEGKIAQSLGDYFLHFCYRYDPTRGGYVIHPMSVMRIGAGATVLAVGGLLGILWTRERVRRSRRERTESSNAPTPAPAPAGRALGLTR